ncbi:MAG: prepilin-type N-terminal cleavage/methylation domain-containing protein [Elusimicrobiaceae bacterium]|nr:prepilin-type N-terminal cleavage/methylation domain-containing protein [Elusimicrobiaceae bacterium]
MRVSKGFTLIELLVVVLIIGILSAVALPQYTIAVKKTRTMSLLPLIRAIDSAEKVYYLETGAYTNQWDNLSIEMPGGASKSGNSMVYKNFVCYFQGGSTGGPSDSSLYCACTDSDTPQIEKYFASMQYICWAEQDSMAEKICKSISGRSTPSGSGTFGNSYEF